MSLLKNIKILDLTRFVAGPHCALVLSDLGAEIIKIEKPKNGDDLRIIGPKISNISLWAAVLNRGKKSFSLDLKSNEIPVIAQDLEEKPDPPPPPPPGNRGGHRGDSGASARSIAFTKLCQFSLCSSHNLQ